MAKKGKIPQNLIIIAVLLVAFLYFTTGGDFLGAGGGFPGGTITSITKLSAETSDPWFNTGNGYTYFVSGTLQPRGEGLYYELFSDGEEIDNSNEISDDTFEIQISDLTEECVYSSVVTRDTVVSKFSLDSVGPFGTLSKSECQEKGGLWFGTDWRPRSCLYPSNDLYYTSRFQDKSLEFDSTFHLLKNGNTINSKSFGSRNSEISLGDDAVILFTGNLGTGKYCPEYSEIFALYDDNQNRLKLLQNDYALSSYDRLKNNLPKNFQSCIDNPGGGEFYSAVQSCFADLKDDLNDEANSVTYSIGAPSVIDWQRAESYKGSEGSGFKIPFSDPNLIENPSFNARINAKIVKVTIPYRKPELVSCSEEKGVLGGTNRLIVDLKNVGDETGNFYTSLKSCPGVVPDRSTVHTSNINPGDTQTIYYSLTENSNIAIDQKCVFEAVNPSNPQYSDTISCQVTFDDTCTKTCNYPFELADDRCECVCKLPPKEGKRITSDCEYADGTPSDAASICGDGICEESEKAKYILGIKYDEGCPKDCQVEDDETQEAGMGILIWIIIGIAVVAFLLLIVPILFKKKPKVKLKK